MRSPPWRRTLAARPPGQCYTDEPRGLGAQPVEVQREPLGAGRQAPVLRLYRVIAVMRQPLQAVRTGLFQKSCALVVQRPMGGFERLAIVDLLTHHGLGTGLLAAHGVDGHQAVFPIPEASEWGDGSDCIGRGVDLEVAENHAMVLGPGADHRHGRFRGGTVKEPATRFAIQRHDVPHSGLA